MCTVTSVLGGMFGYAIGYFLYDSLGQLLIRLYGMQQGIEEFRALLRRLWRRDHPAEGLHPDPVQAGDDRQRLRRRSISRSSSLLRADHPRRALLPARLAAEALGRAGAGLYREAADPGQLAVPRRAHRRLRPGGLAVIAIARPAAAGGRAGAGLAGAGRAWRDRHRLRSGERPRRRRARAGANPGRHPGRGPDAIRTVTGTIEIDCAAGTATALDAKGYDAAGRLMLNAIVPAAERQPEPIRPDSPNAAVRAIVCQRQAR